MTAPVESSLRSLEEGKAGFVEVLKAMSPEQRAFRPVAGGWTAEEIAHHVFRAEHGSVASMIKLTGRRSKSRSLRQRLLKAMVGVVLRLGMRVKAPSKALYPETGVAFEDFEAEWDEVRARLVDVIGAVEEPTRTAGFQHPISGPLTVAEGLDFLARHLRHHRRQLDRLLADSGYPSAGDATG